MKKIELFIITMLFVISYAYADGYRTDEDHWEKVRQLDEMAERFKTETGFRGEVMHSTTTMRLHVYRGNFPGVSFTADGDTTAFRQACEGIISKVLPNSQANSNQLSMSRISKSGRGYTTDYYQQVNGYRVEGAGYIMITFEDGRKYFSISDNTVDLPDGDVGAIISQKKAEEIALADLNDERYSVSKVYNLFFSSEGSGTYYLAYFVVVSSVIDGNLDEYAYWIDAQKGLVKKSCVAPRYESDVVVSVGGNYYRPTVDWNFINNQSDSLAIPNARVWIDNKWSQSNAMGVANVSDVTYSNQKVRLANRHFWMTIRTNADTLATNSFVPDPTVSDYYHVMFPDTSNGVAHYAPNSYVDALSQIDFLNGLIPNYFDNLIKISTACSMNSGGDYAPSTGAIRLKDARVHNIVRHELSHHFVHRVLGHMMGTVNQSAMDEGFANYFGGASKGDPIIPQIGGGWDISLPIHVSNLGLGTITESSYYQYNCGRSLASAWWALRSNPNFSPTAVDTLLVHSLNQVKDGLPVNNTYRYKPRYFYNILMSRVDNDNRSWPFNPKQTAIDSVYSIRGFHYYPRVQSVASADVTTPLGRESYNVLDSVYVHISNYPQNTYVQVFVVEDRDYLNVGDNGIAIPAPYEVDGNPVSGIFKTDGNGKWAGGIPFSRLLPQGDYDIIVNNMVNPTAPNNNPTDPDNTLHLAFKNDYIIDGVDGLDGPGFTKTGTGDIVVALDFSSSMSGYGAQLAQMVKALEQSMIDSERINVFGFTEGTASQGWIEDGIRDMIIQHHPTRLYL